MFNDPGPLIIYWFIIGILVGIISRFIRHNNKKGP